MLVSGDDLMSLSFFSYIQCFPGCLTIQIRTALCLLIVLLIYAVAQACVVSPKRNIQNVTLDFRFFQVFSFIGFREI